MQASPDTPDAARSNRSAGLTSPTPLLHTSHLGILGANSLHPLMCFRRTSKNIYTLAPKSVPPIFTASLEMFEELLLGTGRRRLQAASRGARGARRGDRCRGCKTCAASGAAAFRPTAAVGGPPMWTLMSVARTGSGEYMALTRCSCPVYNLIYHGPELITIAAGITFSCKVCIRGPHQCSIVDWHAENWNWQ